MYNRQENENEVLKSAGVVINWAIRTVMKIVIWTLLIGLIMACVSIAITKTVKIQKEVKTEQIIRP